MAAAGRLLSGHHSAQSPPLQRPPIMPDAPPRGKGGKAGTPKGGKGNAGGKGPNTTVGQAWSCPLCFLPDNYGWRLRCRGCNAHQRRPVGGGSGGADASFDGQGGHGNSRNGTFAERQLQQARADQRKQRKEAAERENKELREELARLRAANSGNRNGARQPAADVNGGGDEDEQDGDDMDASANAYSDWTEEERQQRLVVARAGLAYHITKFGDDAAETNDVREEIASLERASRDAKPFKTHRGLLERKRERLRTKQERDESEVEKIKSEQVELQTKLESLEAAMSERSKVLAQVEEELADLVKRALAEGDAAGPAGQQGDDASSPWSPQAASAILQALANKPGVPPEFSVLLGHVYQAAQAMAAASAAAAPAAAQPHVSSAGNSPTNQPRGGRSPQTTGTGAAASDGGGLAAAGPPTQLAPQGRWYKQGASAEGGTGAVTADSGNIGAKGQTAEAGASGGGSTGTPTTAGGTTSAAASGQSDAAPNNVQKSEGAAAGAQREEDHEPELIDAEMGDPEIDGDVAASISKLPTADQVRLRAALGARGGWRRRAGNDEEGRGSGDRDRERSPRPTKAGGADGEL